MPTASHLSLVTTTIGDGEPDPHHHDERPAQQHDGDDHDTKEASA